MVGESEANENEVGVENEETNSSETVVAVIGIGTEIEIATGIDIRSVEMNASQSKVIIEDQK